MDTYPYFPTKEKKMIKKFENKTYLKDNNKSLNKIAKMRCFKVYMLQYFIFLLLKSTLYHIKKDEMLQHIFLKLNTCEYIYDS